MNDDGLWAHQKFGYSVPRRNGKNEILVMLEMFALRNGQRILHTAHRTSTSHAAWERLCERLDKAKIEYKAIKAKGQEVIYCEDGEINFRTRSSKGGLGEGFDLLIIDEAQEYTDDQESALKYVVSDSQNPMTVFCGTPPTVVSSGTVFTKYREAVLAGRGVDSGWAEWSVENQSDPNDRELWYQTNPSLGTILTERKIVAELGDDEIDFNIQRLGLWLRYNQKSAISETEWNELQVDALPKLTGPLFVGVKYGMNDNVAMSVACRTEDKRIFVEAIDCQSIRNGNDWLLSFFRSVDIAKICVDGSNGQNGLKDDMKDAGIKLKPILPKVAEVIAANADFEQGICSRDIVHAEQPSVLQIVANCEKRAIGSNGGFGYKSQRDGVEVAILDSMVYAYW